MAKSGKVVLIGDFEVGKTSIFTRFQTGVFPVKPPDETRREAECKKIINVDGSQFELHLFDTAGLERHEGTVPPSYFRSASGVIFVYSISDQESIDNTVNWSDSVCPQRLEFVGTDVNIIRALIGNKSDCDSLVSRNRALETADLCGINQEMVFEMSAKEGDGFDDVFLAIARKIMSQGKENTSQPVVNLHTRKTKSGSGCCSS